MGLEVAPEVPRAAMAAHELCSGCALVEAAALGAEGWAALRSTVRLRCVAVTAR